MKQIDPDSWPRREQLRVYSAFANPHFGLCANVDVSALYRYVKKSGISFTVAVVYTLARTANAIPEFRRRIRSEKVVEHAVVHPSITVLTHDDLFGFCLIEYADDFSVFAAGAREMIARAKEHPTLEDEPERDDLLFMTAIPWVSFTAFSHPMPAAPVDSVPRIAWGRFFDNGKTLQMPVAVQAHHAIMDGIHIGRFYKRAQEYMAKPEIIIC